MNHKQGGPWIVLTWMCVHFLGDVSLEPPIPEGARTLDLLVAAAAATTTERSAPMEMEDREDVGEFKVSLWGRVVLTSALLGYVFFITLLTGGGSIFAPPPRSPKLLVRFENFNWRSKIKEDLSREAKFHLPRPMTSQISSKTKCWAILVIQWITAFPTDISMTEAQAAHESTLCVPQTHQCIILNFQWPWVRSRSSSVRGQGHHLYVYLFPLSKRYFIYCYSQSTNGCYLDRRNLPPTY